MLPFFSWEESVLDLCGAEARREIDHDAPPQQRFFHKNSDNN